MDQKKVNNMKFIVTLCLSLFVLQGHSQIIITGFMPSPKRPGKTEANMEYIQLRATQDITFDNDANSFTVVICRNGSAKPEGWAKSEQVHSFSLTSGTVKKGEYFYVGGTEKIIAGAVTVNGEVIKSTDISEKAKITSNRAKWISTHDYTTSTGDVVGYPTGDLIQGWTNKTAEKESNNSNADGIAVFAGTAITSRSIPIDVIFYGTKIGNTINSTGGYTVPVENDHYKSAQGLFGQGTNKFFFDPTRLTPAITGANNGIFFKLSGTYNPSTKSWTMPRSLKLIELYRTDNTWGTLADIEKD